MDGLSANGDVWFTVGPESNYPTAVNRLLRAGATGARVTFSYGTPELQEQVAGMLADAAQTTGRPCTVVADLAGEKVRLAEFSGTDTVELNGDETVRLVSPSRSFDQDAPTFPVDSERFLESLSTGDRVLVGDGAVILSVAGRTADGVECTVVEQGTVEQRRGLVVQDSDFEPRSLTATDREHLSFVADSGAFDAVAISFVSGAGDVEEARERLDGAGREYPIISKIETRAGVRNAEEIAAASDVVMVARGDLGLYLPWEQLGYNVERIVAAAEAAGTPWFMATQVAEGIERFAFPTRAELCDLHRWERRGMAGVLLSYETAFGADPERAVATVRRTLDASAPDYGD